MPCPYKIILGRDTALPSPLYHSVVTGIDIKQSTVSIPSRECGVYCGLGSKSVNPLQHLRYSREI